MSPEPLGISGPLRAPFLCSWLEWILNFSVISQLRGWEYRECQEGSRPPPLLNFPWHLNPVSSQDSDASLPGSRISKDKLMGSVGSNWTRVGLPNLPQDPLGLEWGTPEWSLRRYCLVALEMSCMVTLVTSAPVMWGLRNLRPSPTSPGTGVTWQFPLAGSTALRCPTHPWQVRTPQSRTVPISMSRALKVNPPSPQIAELRILLGFVILF